MSELPILQLNVRFITHLLIGRYYEILTKATSLKSVLYFTLPSSSLLCSGNCRRWTAFQQSISVRNIIPRVSGVLRINHVSHVLVKRNCNLPTTSITSAKVRAILSHYTNISSSSGKGSLHSRRLFSSVSIETQFLTDITFARQLL